MPKPLTKLEIAQNIRNKYNGEYTLVTQGNISGRTKIEVRHKCGNILETTHQSFVNDSNGRCQVCYPIVSEGRKEAITEEILIKRIEPEYSYISGFKNTKVKIKVRHNKCGTVFEVLPKDLFAKKSGCKVCANKNSRGKYLLKENYLEEILSSSIYNDGIDYEWLESYKGGNKQLHLIKHKTCGHEYSVRPNDFQQGYRCPECNKIMPTESKDAKLIREILEELEVPFTMEFTDSRCKHKQLLRFDFMIQLENKKLLIEYDGKQHFQETKGIIDSSEFSNQKARDKAKDEFVKEFSSEFILERITYKDDVFDRITEIFTEHDLYKLFTIIL